MNNMLKGPVRPIAALTVAIGLFSVAFLASQAPPSQSSPVEVTWTAIFATFTALIFLVSWLLIRRISTAAAGVMLTGYIAFVFYGYIQRSINDIVTFEFIRDRFFFQDRIFLPVMIVAIVIIYYGSRRFIRWNPSIARYASAIVLVVAAGHLTLWGIGQAKSYTFTEDRATAGLSLVKPKDQFPIYWMLFDGYGRDDVLAKEFAFDNSPFLSELENRNFTVDRDAFSYCGNTECIVPALMELENFGILDKNSSLALIKGRASAHWRFKESALAILLGTIGYKTVELSSERSPLVTSRVFPIAYYEKTGLNSLPPRLHIWRYFARFGLVKNMKDTASKAGNKDVIVFSYNLAPHPPYYFDSKGRSLNPRVIEPDNKERMKTWDRKDQYIGQLEFVNSQILTTIDEIIEGSEVDPLIVVMSDHGPASNWNEGRITSTPSEALFNERIPILSALLVPDLCRKSELEKSHSSVNTFSAILNACFETDLPLHPDDVWWSLGNPNHHYKNGIWKPHPNP